MKKMIKMLAMLTLVIATVLPTVTPARAWEYTDDSRWNDPYTLSDHDGNVYNGWSFDQGGDRIIYVGQLRQTAGYDSDFFGTTLSYKSSNNKVISIDADGYVVAKKPGKATITVTDGTYTDKYKVTVKDPKKERKAVILNYPDNTYFKSGETFVLKSLSGSSVKSIRANRSADVTIKGNKITVHDVSKNTGMLVLRVTLKDGRKTEVTYTVNSLEDIKVWGEALEIIEKAAKEAGISKSSSDLDKAMFIWNWLGENCRYDVKAYNRLGYIAIREGKGNCSAYAEAVGFISDVIGLTTTLLCNEDNTHMFNGVKVDGEWYVMDTTGCEPWKFVKYGWFLKSQKEYGIKFRIAADSPIKLEFTSTKYDDPEVFAQYADNYVDNYVSDYGDDYWNEILEQSADL